MKKTLIALGIVASGLFLSSCGAGQNVDPNTTDSTAVQTDTVSDSAIVAADTTAPAVVEDSTAGK